MKKIILVWLICSGMALAAPLSLKEQLNINKPAKKPKSALFADSRSDEGVNFDVTVKHDDKGSRITNYEGPIKELNLLPLNSISGGLTYSF